MRKSSYFKIAAVLLLIASLSLGAAAVFAYARDREVDLGSIFFAVATLVSALVAWHAGTRAIADRRMHAERVENERRAIAASRRTTDG